MEQSDIGCHQRNCLRGDLESGGSPMRQHIVGGGRARERPRPSRFTAASSHYTTARHSWGLRAALAATRTRALHAPNSFTELPGQPGMDCAESNMRCPLAPSVLWGGPRILPGRACPHRGHKVVGKLIADTDTINRIRSVGRHVSAICHANKRFIE